MVIIMKKYLKGVAGTALALGAGSAFASAETAIAALEAATADVSTIGWAVFSVLIAAMAFKYMRRAL